jgi:flagellar biosynthesis protein FliR
MIIVAPMVGHQSVPVQVKVALGLFVSYVMYPVVAAQQHTVPLELAGITVVAVKEIFLGLLVGFVIGLIFSGVRLAGELIAFDMGISMANVFDPESNQSNPVVGEFLYIVMLLVFLTLNGHHFIFQSLHFLFNSVPLGGLTITAPLADWMIKLTGIVFILGVKMAAPVIVASFLMNVALAVLSRVVPQMNIFSVSFPLKIGVGYAVLISSAPLMIYVFKKILTGFENNILEMMKVL